MSKRIYFHIVDPALGKKFHPVYQYDYIPLAQGLSEMGFEICSNMNYWRGLNGDYLFRYNPAISAADCPVNVFSGLCQHYGYKMDQELFKNSSVLKILIEQNDGIFTPLFSESSRKFDMILHKKSRGRAYPKNCVSSWAFGLSNEISQIAALYQKRFGERKKEILCNFRYGHTVRNYATNYLSTLKLNRTLNTKTDAFDFNEYNGTRYENMLNENGGRHRPNYLELLSQSQVCATFGGFFYFHKILDRTPFTYRIGNYLLPDRAGGAIVDIIKKSGVHLKKTSSIYQWDSWRYWEAYACGCANLNVDFQYYGIELPEMPENMVHYIGLNFNKSKKYNEELLNLQPEILQKIASNGHAWANKHYAPRAVASRFLKITGIHF